MGVARDLIGCILETRYRGVLTAGRIVETEAYVGPHDPAAHGYRGRKTLRNARLFGPPGTSYVYFIYGMHWCFNAVTECVDYPAAVLIRALEPLQGLEVMARRRKTDEARLFCSGPARLCQALRITGAQDGVRLDQERLRILDFERNEGRRGRIKQSPRIGVTRAADWPLRFFEAGSPWLTRRLGFQRRAIAP